MEAEIEEEEDQSPVIMTEKKGAEETDQDLTVATEDVEDQTLPTERTEEKDQPHLTERTEKNQLPPTERTEKDQLHQTKKIKEEDQLHQTRRTKRDQYLVQALQIITVANVHQVQTATREQLLKEEGQVDQDQSPGKQANNRDN